MNHIINLGLSQRKVILAEFNSNAHQSKQPSHKEYLFAAPPALWKKCTNQKPGRVEEDHVHEVTAEQLSFTAGKDNIV